MKPSPYELKRRHLLKLAGAAALGANAPLAHAINKLELVNGPVLKKAIPSADESLSVIGLGSSRTFNDYLKPDVAAELTKILRTFFRQQGQLIDSSPMYGPAETAIGHLLADVAEKKGMFSATKVWTEGKQAGIEQMQSSMSKMGVEVMDLMQIHNLVDWQVHLHTLREWQEQGKVRYIGITTSHGRDHNELLAIMAKEPLDFVQFSYNIVDREVEKRLLPMAAEKGIAVLVNRPYARGALFKQVKGQELPEWAAEFNCQSWGQFFLKFVVSHPAVTCAIPATSKHKHLLDNMGAGFGRLPDAKERAKMIALLS